MCEDNNLKKLSERITLQKWNRSEASKSTYAAGVQKNLDSATLELKNLKESGILRAKGEFVNIPPITKKLDFSNNHLQKRMEERNLKKEDVISIAQNAKCALKQRNGTQYVYYSENGFVAIQTDGMINSAGELDDGGKALMEVAEKHGLFK